jgi:hypothetical protein
VKRLGLGVCHGSDAKLVDDQGAKPTRALMPPLAYPKVADWREVVRIVLNIDPEQEPNRARRVFDSHLARAKWVSNVGYKQLLRRGWPSGRQ